MWNERPSGPPDYTIALRQSLDAAGFGDTKIILPDGAITGERGRFVTTVLAVLRFRPCLAFAVLQTR